MVPAKLLKKLSVSFFNRKITIFSGSLNCVKFFVFFLLAKSHFS